MVNSSLKVRVTILPQDERNSLLDLSRECKKALSNLDRSSIDAALLATHQITGEISLCDGISKITMILVMAEEATKLHSQDEQFHRRVKELNAMAKRTTELADTTMALAQVGTCTSYDGHLD